MLIARGSATLALATFCSDIAAPGNDKVNVRGFAPFDDYVKGVSLTYGKGAIGYGFNVSGLEAGNEAVTAYLPPEYKRLFGAMLTYRFN
jgi:hypothetical protein